ncbi:unnamed protein product [Alternaria alternata]
MKKQATVNYKVLDQVEAVKSATLNCLSEDDHFEADKDEKNTGSPKKCVTLSDLLNVIDGAQRVERAFEISYASKASSITTFKRLFGNDGCERYTSDAITCFAQAFQAQFPSKPSITTVELAKFCGQYRGRPDIAVKEFADWLQRSADNFSCPADYTRLILVTIWTTDRCYRRLLCWAYFISTRIWHNCWDDGCHAQSEKHCAGFDVATPALGLPSTQNTSPGSDLVPEFMDAGFGNDIQPLLRNHISTVEASPTP